jgi:hypothetical protein
MVYSLWIGSEIWVADDAAGPFAQRYGLSDGIAKP